MGIHKFFYYLLFFLLSFSGIKAQELIYNQNRVIELEKYQKQLNVYSEIDSICSQLKIMPKIEEPHNPELNSFSSLKMPQHAVNKPYSYQGPDFHFTDKSNFECGVRTRRAEQLSHDQFIPDGPLKGLTTQQMLRLSCNALAYFLYDYAGGESFSLEKNVIENFEYLSKPQQYTILELHNYYSMGNFAIVAKYLPYYPEYIIHFYTRYKERFCVIRGLSRAFGNTPWNIEKLYKSALRIKELQECNRKSEQQKCVQEKQQKQHVRLQQDREDQRQKERYKYLQSTQINQKEFCAQLLDDYYDDLYGYDEDDDFYDCDDVFLNNKQQKKRIEQRYHALKQSCEDDFAITKKNAALSGNTTKVINDFSLDKNAFLTCEGSAYQHAIHKELVSVLDTLGNQYALAQSNKVLHAITRNTVNFVGIAQELNGAAQIKKATFAADLCWALLDYSSAVVEGVAQGAVATAHTFMHPIETINNVVGAIKTVDYYTAVFLLHVADIDQAIEMHDFDNAHIKSQALVEYIENNIQFLCGAVKETSGRELVRGAAAFATEGYLTGKATHACSQLFTQAKISLVPVLEKVKDTAQKYYKDFNTIPTKEFKYALACEVPEILIAHKTAESLMLLQESERAIKGSEMMLPSNRFLEKIVEQKNNISVSTHLAPRPKKNGRTISHIISDKHEINELVEAYKFMEIDKNIGSLIKLDFVELTEETCKHCFGVQVERFMKSSGKIKEIFSGFHYDLSNCLEKNGIYSIKEIVPINKFAQEIVFFDNITMQTITKTIFRNISTRSEVIELLGKSLKNITNIPELTNNRWPLEGKVGNVLIRSVIDIEGKLITFYPVKEL